MVDEKNRTRAAVFVGFIMTAIILGIFFWVVSRNRIISPLPPDSGIKIIFLSPTPIPAFLEDADKNIDPKDSNL